jgi:hypothetical protein
MTFVEQQQAVSSGQWGGTHEVGRGSSESESLSTTAHCPLPTAHRPPPTPYQGNYLVIPHLWHTYLDQLRAEGEKDFWLKIPNGN